MPEGFKTQGTRLLTTAASFCHKADLWVSLICWLWARCKIYYSDCDLSGFVNWSKPAALVEQLEYMVDRVRFTPSSLKHSQSSGTTSTSHWMATGTSSHVACRRCWGMFEVRGEGPPHVQASTSNSFPFGFVFWKKKFFLQILIFVFLMERLSSGSSVKLIS